MGERIAGTIEQTQEVMSDDAFFESIMGDVHGEGWQDRQEQTEQVLREHYGDQLFRYGSHIGTIDDMLAVCPMMESKVLEGFDAVVAYIDEYKTTQTEIDAIRAEDEQLDEDTPRIQHEAQPDEESTTPRQRDTIHPVRPVEPAPVDAAVADVSTPEPVKVSGRVRSHPALEASRSEAITQPSGDSVEKSYETTASWELHTRTEALDVTSHEIDIPALPRPMEISEHTVPDAHVLPITIAQGAKTEVEVKPHPQDQPGELGVARQPDFDDTSEPLTVAVFPETITEASRSVAAADRGMTATAEMVDAPRGGR